jgi:hypothetical protein
MKRGAILVGAILLGSGAAAAALPEADAGAPVAFPPAADAGAPVASSFEADAGAAVAAPPGTEPGAAAPVTDGGTTSAPADELPHAGYVPGYRQGGIGMSPYSPRVGGLPGGMTPGYRAPMPAGDWTFRWNGFLTASLQGSVNDRTLPGSGQSKTVLHAPPQTLDEYGSFLGTATMPGQWAQLNFAYGNRYVTANVSLTTWNPTDPSTYYQLGSQQFINNMYLSYSPPPIGSVRLHALAGYFYNAYGVIGQYGPGIYTNAIVGGVRGVGEDLVAEYDLSDSMTLTVEDGVMGSRNGMGAINIVPSGQNGAGSIIWPSAWLHHLHAGFERRGDITLRAHIHYITNWAQDDRVQCVSPPGQTCDNPVTRQIDESYVKDGRIQAFGMDVAALSSLWGYLGTAVSYTRGDNAYPVKGAITFGGDGETLTNRWWGQTSSGTGELLAAGINYSASIGRIVSYPVPFNQDGPDLSLNAGFVFAESWSEFQPFDARMRYKGGADLLYTFLPYAAVGFRADAVVPNSHDAEETFYVIAPRLVLKSDWTSRDTITLVYGKWFCGPHTHPETSSVTCGERLDDQLFALNAQMWW